MLTSAITTDQTAATTSVSNTSALGKDEFLRLLITQLRYQNPLEPVGNEEFVAQLAQFSSLEQMKNIASGIDANTELLSSMQSELTTNTQIMSSAHNALAVSLIGREAVFTASELAWSGDDDQPMNLGLWMPEAGDARVEIYDSTGAKMGEIDFPSLSAGATVVSWHGELSSGDRLAAGSYSLKVVATNSAGTAMAAEPLLTGEVVGVSFAQGVPLLTVGSMQVPLSVVREINA